MSPPLLALSLGGHGKAPDWPPALALEAGNAGQERLLPRTTLSRVAFGPTRNPNPSPHPNPHPDAGVQLLIVISRFDIDGDGDIDEQEFEISRKEGEKAISNAIAGCQARCSPSTSSP